MSEVDEKLKRIERVCIDIQAKVSPRRRKARKGGKKASKRRAAPKRRTAKRTTSKRKTAKRKTAKRRAAPKRRTAKRRAAPKRRTAKRTTTKRASSAELARIAPALVGKAPKAAKAPKVGAGRLAFPGAIGLRPPPRRK